MAAQLAASQEGLSSVSKQVSNNYCNKCTSTAAVLAVFSRYDMERKDRPPLQLTVPNKDKDSDKQRKYNTNIFLVGVKETGNECISERHR
jgi:hypothetical protein